MTNEEYINPKGGRERKLNIEDLPEEMREDLYEKMRQMEDAEKKQMHQFRFPLWHVRSWKDFQILCRFSRFTMTVETNWEEVEKLPHHLSRIAYTLEDIEEELAERLQEAEEDEGTSKPTGDENEEEGKDDRQESEESKENT
jgi:hypothetical protein